MNSRRRHVITAVAWLVSLHVLLAYGLPEWLFALLAASAGILYWRLGAPEAVTVSLTLIAVTLVYATAIKITGLDERIYYRPDERYGDYDYAHNHRRYRPDIHVDFDMPHGDLRAMTTLEIAEPRRTRFVTDRDGFRNLRDYHGQRYLLVGDSFIAGSSNSQEAMLVEQLRSHHGIDAYNLAYPGNLADYAAYVRGFRKRHPDEVRILLFLFEGNDFENIHLQPPGGFTRLMQRWYSLFSDFGTLRVTRSLYKRMARTNEISSSNNVGHFELAGKPVLCYREYDAVTRRASFAQPDNFEKHLVELIPLIERVYFIPTKTRVYARSLGVGSLPNAQWAYLEGLCRHHDLRCTNLTDALVRGSEQLLRKGELTWWRDDTHWNGRGAGIAASVVAGNLDAGQAGK